MRRWNVIWASALVGGLLGCGGPEQPPNPECPPGAECEGYEPGMTTGKTEEVLDPELPLEERAQPEASAPETQIGSDSVIGTQPLSGQ